MTAGRTKTAAARPKYHHSTTRPPHTGGLFDTTAMLTDHPGPTFCRRRFLCDRPNLSSILPLGESKIWTLVVSGELPPVCLQPDGSPVFDAAEILVIAQRSPSTAAPGGAASQNAKAARPTGRSVTQAARFTLEAGTVVPNSQRPLVFRNRPSLLGSERPSLGQGLARRQGRAGRPLAPHSGSSHISAISRPRHPATSSTTSPLSPTHPFETLNPFLLPATMTIPFPTISTQSTAPEHEQFGTYSSIPYKTYTPDAPQQFACHNKTRHKSP